MSAERPYPEQVALTMLRRFGLAVVWDLHLSASRADRDGNRLAAISIIEIADAAEREWLKKRDADLNRSSHGDTWQSPGPKPAK